MGLAAAVDDEFGPLVHNALAHGPGGHSPDPAGAMGCVSNDGAEH